MTNANKAETVKATSTVSASTPTVSFNELIGLLNAVRLAPSQRVLATNLITAFVAASDAANAMSAAAIAASDAATAVLNASNVTNKSGNSADDEMPTLIPASPNSETGDDNSPYVIICGGGPCIRDGNPHLDHKRTTVPTSSIGAGGPKDLARFVDVIVPATVVPTIGDTADTVNAAEANTDGQAVSSSQPDSDSGGAAAPSSSAPSASHPWYCVTVGRRVGVFPHWSIVSPLVTGVSNACFAKHPDRATAQAIFQMAVDADAVRVVPHPNAVFVAEEGVSGDN